MVYELDLYDWNSIYSLGFQSYINWIHEKVFYFCLNFNYMQINLNLFYLYFSHFLRDVQVDMYEHCNTTITSAKLEIVKLNKKIQKKTYHYNKNNF